MLCNRCKKREAKIYYTEIIKGQKKEEYLCEECAMSFNSFQGAIPNLGGLLSSILSNYFGEQLEERETKEKSCSICGMTSSEFMKVKKAGCLNCYKVFGEVVEKSVKQTQGATKHKGKRPKTLVVELEKTLESISKVERLEILLQQAIEREEFEEAVKLRDEIRALKKEEAQKNVEYKNDLKQSENEIEEIYEKES